MVYRATHQQAGIKVTKSVKIECGSIADMVIDRFGGMVAMSKVTRFSFDQIRNMRRRGNLTEDERASVIEDAQPAGVRLSSVDFIKHLVPFG